MHIFNYTKFTSYYMKFETKTLCLIIPKYKQFIIYQAKVDCLCSMRIGESFDNASLRSIEISRCILLAKLQPCAEHCRIPKLKWVSFLLRTCALFPHNPSLKLSFSAHIRSEVVASVEARIVNLYYNLKKKSRQIWSFTRSEMIENSPL